MVYLVLVVCLDAAGITCLKLSRGFAVPGFALGMLLCYGIELACLALALRRIPMSLAYAIRCGAGTALVTLIGCFAFHEPLTMAKAASLGLIALGVAGLNLSKS